MKNPAEIARSAGFELSTVDAEAFELCFDLHGGNRVLATFLWDGKPQNAHTDASACDQPVGWCIQFTYEVREGELVVWCFRCDPNRLDLATAMACGMLQERMHKRGWWQPLPDHRLWDEENPSRVRAHQRIQPDPMPTLDDQRSRFGS